VNREHSKYANSMERLKMASFVSNKVFFFLKDVSNKDGAHFKAFIF